jgi:hypothetical protein
LNILLIAGVPVGHVRHFITSVGRTLFSTNLRRHLAACMWLAAIGTTLNCLLKAHARHVFPLSMRLQLDG